MRYIEWEIEHYPEQYSQLRCNQVLDMQTLAHVICNVDRPDGVKWEDFKKVLNEVAETINIVPYVTLENAKVDNAPAVDAVEVVRCKDCVNMGKRLPLPKGYREDCGCCMAHGWIVSPEDFCSWGETADEKDRREAAEQDAYEQLCNLGNPEDGSL